MMRGLAAVTAGITATIAAAGAALGLRRRRRAARRAERRAAKHRSGSPRQGVTTASSAKPTSSASGAEEAASSHARASGGADASASAAEPISLHSIKGIGDVAAKRLQAAGITRVDEIAAWSDADLERIAGEISISVERIRREDWVGQARKLSSAG